jgi:hypothetical protein
VTEFLDEALEAEEEFTFTINSVRNPTVTGASYEVTVEILSESLGVVDIGTYTIDDDEIVAGEIWKFEVTPQDTGVGQFPVFYDFEIQPSGEIYEDCYLVIRMPDEVAIYQER